VTTARTSSRPLSRALAITGLVGASALAACSGGADGDASSSAPSSSSSAAPAAALAVTSTSYQEGGAIPAALTCDGDDTSPQLAWSGAPDGTATYAITMTDPDADGFVHWVVANLPPDLTSLDEGAAPTLGKADGPAPDAVAGLTSFGKPGYRGPCPPSGTHHYVVTVYALGSAVEGTPTAASVAEAALASGTLTGTYAAAG